MYVPVNGNCLCTAHDTVWLQNIMEKLSTHETQDMQSCIYGCRTKYNLVFSYTRECNVLIQIYKEPGNLLHLQVQKANIREEKKKKCY